MTEGWRAESASTWRDGPAGPVIPDALRVDRTVGVRRRLANWRARHALRRRRAEEFFANSRRPERGLPVAGRRRAFRFVGGLLARRRWLLVWVLVLNVLAAVAALIVPREVGRLVDAVAAAGTPLAAVDAVLLGLAAVVVAQAVLTFLARRASAVLGWDLLASAREEVVRIVLRLPLGRVESGSTGDLLTRITSDVAKMSDTVRALPHLVMALTTVVLTAVGLALNSLLLTLPIVLTVGVLVVVVRSYLRRAAAGYITESGGYAQVNASLTETVEGARTVEALGLQRLRVATIDDDIEVTAQAERYTMSLRNLLFIWLDPALLLPQVGVILLGGWGVANGVVTIGQVTAASLYLQQLIGPVDRLIQVLDVIQVGLAATTRLLGVAEVPDDRTPTDARPAGTDLVGSDLRFAYRAGHDVLHGVDLELAPGERVAVVGPSGSGKSTLGRLLSGVNRPRTGRVEVGDVDVMELPLDLLRTEVALITQEHHVFVGTVRDNIVLAREGAATDAEVRAALAAVDALAWVERLPSGLDTVLGRGRLELTPAQAQQVALARLVLADPHTLVLDEATSLIDPRTARLVEGSLSALLTGRAVVAIAHRLYSAHDADRIAVVSDGRIVELGSHDELLAADGEYARLWHTWRS